MTDFALPADLHYNRGLIADPVAYARDGGYRSWLYLVAALDRLPRPTLVSCRTGPRGSAVAYLYAGLKLGATYEEILGAAERDHAPFLASEEIKEWVRASLETLRSEAGTR